MTNKTKSVKPEEKFFLICEFLFVFRLLTQGDGGLDKIDKLLVNSKNKTEIQDMIFNIYHVVENNVSDELFVDLKDRLINSDVVTESLFDLKKQISIIQNGDTSHSQLIH